MQRANAVENGQGVIATDLEDILANIKEYAKDYQELMARAEQAENLRRIIEGLTSNLERKSVEPIALMHEVPRRNLQRFVGENGWDHRPLIRLQQQEVAAEIGVPDGTIVIDGSATPKKGKETVGVKRQWCGRLGKVDNCVIGVYAAYIGAEDCAALVNSELYLPQEWTADEARRHKGCIPTEVQYKTQPEIAKAMIENLAMGPLPFQWVLGDDEFGRATEFRDAIAKLGRHYILDVPENTSVHRVTPRGYVREKKWSIKTLAKGLRASDWTKFVVRDGEKGPIEVRAVAVRVATERTGGRWVQETLVIIETIDQTQQWCCLANAPPQTTLKEFVRRAGQRHRIEEVFQETKGEVGLDHYEVRAWHGWHHHMAICQIAHWFLVRERRRLGAKNVGITVSQIRMAIGPLLAPPWTPARAASFINYHRLRNYESKRARYVARGLLPPILVAPTGRQMS